MEASVSFVSKGRKGRRRDKQLRSQKCSKSQQLCRVRAKAGGAVAAGCGGEGAAAQEEALCSSAPPMNEKRGVSDICVAPKHGAFHRQHNCVHGWHCK